MKRRVVHRVQRLVVNPIGRQLPVTMLETTGRKSGQPRGAPRSAEAWWITSSGWSPSMETIRTTCTNIKANPAVRVRIGGKWRNGTAHLLPDDDAWQRLRSLPRLNSAGVRTMGTDLLTIRVDLE